MTPNVRPIVAGNWKMNGLRSALGEIRSTADGAAGLADIVDLVLCPPTTLLYVATTLTEDTELSIGAQDCHVKAAGAHTGDISAEMIADCLATHVIVGHSERRAAYGETDTLVAAKATAAHDAGLVAIVCIGETEDERRAGTTLDVVGRQLAGSLPDGADGENTIVAYEPVWAIGSGLTPSAADVAEVHGFMREKLASRFGAEGERMPLLYGGSVKPSNAAELMAVANVDGALVGGASLKSSDFLAICGVYRGLLG